MKKNCFFMLIVLMSLSVSADVKKVFSFAPFAAQESGEIVYSQKGNFIIEGNVFTQKVRSFECNFKLNQSANERMNLHHLDPRKMILVKESLDVEGWQREAWEINFSRGSCKSVDLSTIGEMTYVPSFGFKRKVALSSLNLEVKAPFMYNQGGLECYGIKIVNIQPQEESGFKWDKFCGRSYGVNLIAIQNHSNVALLHDTNQNRYDLYIGYDNFKSDQAFKYIDSIHTSSSSLTFMNLKNDSNSILIFTLGRLGKSPAQHNQGVYTLKLQ